MVRLQAILSHLGLPQEIRVVYFKETEVAKYWKEG